jgi:hypothetical protein
MDKICKYFNITKHHTEKPYYSIRLVQTHTIDDDIGKAIVEGSIQYVSKLNAIYKNKNKNNACNTVVDMANIERVTDYGASAIANLNAWHAKFFSKPIKLLNCQDSVLRQINKASVEDISRLVIGCDDLVRLYGKVQHHTHDTNE